MHKNSRIQLRKRFFKLVEPSQSTKGFYYAFDLFLIALIILNVLAAILASVDELDDQYHHFFEIFEWFSIIVFTGEYVVRIWTCVEIEKFKNPISGRIRYVFSFMALVDLLAILPFYLPFVGFDLRAFRILRIFLMFRLLKMARYIRAFSLIKNVLKEKKEELLVTLMLIVIILVIVSTLMFYAEKDAQPEAFSNIPKALWWGVVTLTTVGYGDIYPVTTLGKILGGIITLLGIALIALPSGILASGYTDQMNKRKNKEN